MGKINKGIMGAFSGKVGPVIGGSWKNIDYMRSLPIPSGSNSPLQKNQRTKFGTASRFLTPLKDLLKTSYQPTTGIMTARNSALSYILYHAATGAYPDITLNYNQVRVTQGSLHNVNSCNAVSNMPGKIFFQWNDNSGRGSAKVTDKTILVAYCVEMPLCIFSRGATTRNQLTAELDVMPFSGKTVHTWLGFYSENEKDIASSVYAGELVIQ